MTVFARWYAPCMTAALGLLCAPWPQAEARSYEADLCTRATEQVERAMRIPDGFLSAMSRVESGRMGSDGVVAAWPWTVTAAGVGHYYQTREEAVAAVETFRQQGTYSLDVGCMQVNLQQHPNAFPSVEQAFDPVHNAQYAGEFLLQLHEKTGSWPRAAAAYHSQTPGIGTPYQWKVLEAWAVPQDGRDTQASPHKVAHGGQPSPFLPVVAVRSRPILLPNEDGQPTETGAPAPSRIFHPFMGNQHFVEPAPRRPASAGLRGRSLASYRAAPVAMAMPHRLPEE